MKKERVPIPKPHSSFLVVQCSNCGNEQIVFSSSTMDIKCKVCGQTLIVRTGGKARVLGVVARTLD